MRTTLKIWMLAAGLLAGLAAAPALANQDPAAAGDGPEFRSWLDGITRDAATQGLPRARVAEILAQVRFVDRVITQSRAQPEFVRTFYDYMAGAVSAQRVAQGAEKLAEHRASLDAATARYGVPGRFIVAIWGLESAFGRIQGDDPVIDMLATRAFLRRERGTFRQQLIDALALVIETGRAPGQLRGSWAGAMGQPQFMPSAYRAYAQDGTGDGVADIWGEPRDVFASIANYLAEHGWRTGETWGREVRVPDGFDWRLADLATTKPLTAWRDLGLRRADGGPLPVAAGIDASLVLPAGHQGPAFLVYGNFRSILRYNNAVFYATAIGHLADRLVGKPGLVAERPSDDRPLRHDSVVEMQTLLDRLGYAPGPADGIPGSRTRAALRQFQADAGLPADGHLSLPVLERLRATAPAAAG